MRLAILSDAARMHRWCGRLFHFNAKAHVIAVFGVVLLTSSPTGAADEPVVQTLEIESTDMVYDATRALIWLSVPSSASAYADRVIGVNPSTLEVEEVIEVGNDPLVLAMADNERFLYVSVKGDRGYQRIDLEGFSVSQVYPLASDTGQHSFAEEMDVVPGDPGAVAVSLQSAGTSAHNGVAIYDEGVARENIVDWPEDNHIIAFGTEGDLLFGDNRRSDSRLTRMEVDETGVNRIDDFGDFLNSSYGTPRTMEYFDGWIITGTGAIIDPYEPGFVAFLPEQGHVTADRDLHRIYQVVIEDSVVWLNVYETETFTRLERIEIPGFSGVGAPSQIVRWGHQGLAIRTTKDHLVVLESDAIANDGSEANLHTEILTGSPNATPGEALSYRIRVSNSGPDGAESVSLVHTLPEGLELIDADSDSGTVDASEDVVQLEWGALAAGEAREVTVNTVPGSAGRFALSAEALSTTRDPKPAAAVGHGAVHVDRPDSAHRVAVERRLLVNDLATDPGNGIVYATADQEDPLYGNRVLTIDATSGEVLAHAYVGPNPGRLVLTGDRRFLYVLVRDGYGVVRIELETGEPDLEFKPEIRTIFPRYVNDLLPLPEAPESVAIAMGQDSDPDGVAIYDNGVPRENESEYSDTATLLAPGNVAHRIYGFQSSDFYRFSIDDSGVSQDYEIRDFASGHTRTAVKFGENLYLNRGDVIAPHLARPVGQFASNESVRIAALPVESSNRTLFLTRAGGIESYETDRFDRMGELTIPSVSGPQGRLLSRGGNGLVFADEQSLIFFDTTLTHSEQSNLRVEVENAPVDMRVGMPWTYTVEMTNEGSEPVTQLKLSQFRGSTLLNVEEVDSSMGKTSLINHEAEVFIESLQPGQTAEVSVTIRPRSDRTYSPSLEISSVEVDEDTSLRDWEFPFTARPEGSLSVDLPGEATEGDGVLTAAGTVTLNETEAFDAVFSLESSNPSKLNVGETVTVPAGQSSATFDLEIVDNDLLDGSREVTVTGEAVGFEPASGSMTVHDNETGELALLLPENVVRGATAVAEVRIDRKTTDAVVATISTDDSDWLVLPGTVTIPAGNDRAEFEFSASELMPPADGRGVSVDASISGWPGASGELLILPPAPERPFNPFPSNSGRFASSSPQLVWNDTRPVELLVNRYFFTGDLHGWNWESTGDGGWTIDDGTYDPPGPLEPQPPLASPYSAVSYQSGDGTAALFQDVFLPHGAESITLNWSEKIYNSAEEFAPESQEFRAEIREPDGELLETLFVTEPGYQLWGRLHFGESDLTEYAGRQVRLMFRQTHDLDYLNVYLDYALLEATFPEDNFAEGDMYDVYLGRSPYLASEDFLATVETPSLPVEDLDPGVTYYWQVVVHRGDQSAFSPVWSFRTAVVDTVITAPAGPTTADLLEFQVVFTEPVTPPSVDDFLITNSVEATISGENAEYTVSVVPEGYGDVVVEIPENIVHNGDDEGNASAAASVFYTGSASFSRWRDMYFSAEERQQDPEGTALEGDAGNTGVPNLLRYATGMRDGAIDRSLLPRVTTEKIAGDKYAAIAFHWQPDPVDIAYTVETSEDLQNWTAAGDAVEMVSTEDAGHTQRIVVRTTESTTDGPIRFLRLKVHETAE